MRKLSAWIQRVSTGKVVLATLIVFIAFTAAVLPDQAAKAGQYNGPAAGIDTRFSYTPQQLLDTAEAYGEDGRSAYVQARWTFDVIWPLVYTAFLATGVSHLLNKAFSPEGGWQLLNLVPVFTMLFDFIENSAASLVMVAYPAQPLWLAWIAAIATPTKWVLIGGSFVLLLVGLIGWGIRALRKGKAE